MVAPGPAAGNSAATSAAEKLLTTNMAEGRARLVATSGSRFLGTGTAPKPSRKRVKLTQG